MSVNVYTAANKRKRAGRKPLLDPGQRRTQRAIALLTMVESERLDRVIEFLGKTQSDYIRGLLLPDIERIEYEMEKELSSEIKESGDR